MCGGCGTNSVPAKFTTARGIRVRVALQFEQVVRQAPRNSGIVSTEVSRIQVCYGGCRVDYQFLAHRWEGRSPPSNLS
jgi:hypothetical protein